MNLSVKVRFGPQTVRISPSTYYISSNTEIIEEHNLCESAALFVVCSHEGLLVFPLVLSRVHEAATETDSGRSPAVCWSDSTCVKGPNTDVLITRGPELSESSEDCSQLNSLFILQVSEGKNSFGCRPRTDDDCFLEETLSSCAQTEVQRPV